MAAGAPVTTLIPFNQPNVLPACAAQCGPLYDANGACVPPAHPAGAPSVYTQCFCSYAALQPFSTGADGVCGAEVCTNTADLSSIAGWYQSLCGGGQKQAAQSSTSSSSSTGAASQDTASSHKSTTNHNGPWFSTHWQWVLMLIILVIAISGSWIGACIWRRRYLRKKDRQSAVAQKHSGSVSHPSWGPAVTGERSALSQAAAIYGTDEHSSGGPGGFVTPSSVFEDEKPQKEKKRWLVGDRT